jgi:hypothetical protein
MWELLLRAGDRRVRVDIASGVPRRRWRTPARREGTSVKTNGET